MRKIFMALGLILLPNMANAACLKVQDDSKIILSDETLAPLKAINYGRKELFDALYRTSLYETGGCWATPVGNFDAQTLSVGVLQWNYGQNSLQDLFIRYRAKFTTQEEFDQNIQTIMPQYGKLAFSPDCLNNPVAQTCKDQILAAHDDKGKLNPTIDGEYQALFNSLTMRQVQTEKFIDFLNDLAPKLNALFPSPTDKQVKWGIDLAIQQGFLKYNNQNYLLNPADVNTIRKLYLGLDTQKKRGRAYSILHWYGGLCGGIYQGVKTEQCNFNIQKWCSSIKHGLNEEDFDLLNLTYVRSRIAQGQSGRWQANAFARRTKLVLQTGWIGDDKQDLPEGIKDNGNCDVFKVVE